MSGHICIFKWKTPFFFGHHMFLLSFVDLESSVNKFYNADLLMLIQESNNTSLLKCNTKFIQ